VGEVRLGIEGVRPTDPAQAAALEAWLARVCKTYASRILPITQGLGFQEDVPMSERERSEGEGGEPDAMALEAEALGRNAEFMAYLEGLSAPGRRRYSSKEIEEEFGIAPASAGEPREPMLYDLLMLGPDVGEDADFERRVGLRRPEIDWGD